jgi:hypothetical protein
MTALMTVMLLAYDPPTPTAPPAGDKKQAAGKTVDGVKADAKKESESLFKRKRSKTKTKEDSEDARLTPEGPSPTKTPAKEPPKSKLTDADKDLVKSLGGALSEDEEDPLVRAAQRMRAVEEQLAKLQIKQETVVTQEKIVSDLKEIIERARKKAQQQQQQQQQKQNQQDQQQQQQQQAQRNQQQQQQSQRDNESSKGDRGAQKTKEQIAKNKEQRDVWGHLPEMERAMLNQSYREEKLPEFRTQLEKYYSKIAELSAEKDR